MGLSNEYAAGALNARPAPFMCFDIETCPMPSVLDYLVEPVEAPANYKDPLKIAAYVADKREQQVFQAALDLDLCEVVAVAGAFPDTTWALTREHTSEADMLRGFWRFTSTVLQEFGVLIGFNCLAFDLPILLRRSLYLGIETPRISVDKYRHDGVIDLADVLSFSGKTKWRSLAFYAKRFGMPYDTTTDGAEIPALVAAQDWAAVEAHVRADVDVTKALALRIGVVTPENEQVL